MLKSKLTFFRWLVFGVIGLLALWMIGGNLLASHLEKEIEREIARKLKELEEQYPDPEPNDSALKLEAILSKEFGIGGIGKTNGQGVIKFGDYMGYHPDFKASNNDDFDRIQELLSQYIDSQISKPDDEIEPAPQELQNYLKSKADALSKLQNHVLNNELPKSETMIDNLYLLEGDDSVALPSYLYLANVQRILALDILEKQRQGKNQEAREMLEVSWRISQLLQNRSTLIAQLVALIIGTFQTGVIRKVDNLSPYWEDRLLEYDYRLSVLKTIEIEFLGGYNQIRNLDFYIKTGEEFELSYYFDIDEELPNYQLFLFSFLINNPLSKPYLRFLAIDSYQTMIQSIDGLPTRNVCSPEEKLKIHISWWNFFDYYISPASWANQEVKAAKYMLELEFTQKILQVKELAKKQGKWPDSFPNLESKFCSDRQYIYQVSEDGTMTISLDKQPEWAKDRDLPLTYSDRTPPK